MTDPHMESLKRFAESLEKMGIRWEEKSENHVKAFVGSEVKEHLIKFVKTDKGWNFDHWSPGVQGSP